ncbi:MAG: polysaccharide deacetylase family protein [Hyphomicrobium sp.]
MRIALSIAVSIALASAAAAGAPPKNSKGTAAATPPPPAAAAPAAPACANPNALGIGRTVEIDTTGGPGFGLEQYKAYDFLEAKEIVLTFDDGPQVITTPAVLDALAHHCTKATFFSIGKMAVGLPEIIREVAKRGHTIGTHTWSHADLRAKKTPKEGIDEIERGISAVRRAVGVPIAPFFRFPFLKDSPEMIAHLGSRNIAVFSMDADSFDFKFRDPEKIVKIVMDKLEKKGKGIVLMHDINPFTAKAVPKLLDELKAKDYRVVHVKAAAEATTLAEYDQLIEKDVKGLPGAGSEKPLTSIVKTVPTAP